MDSGSVSTAFSVGSTAGGSAAGSLSIFASSLHGSPNVYTPAGLTASTYPGATVLTDGSGAPRQVLSADAVADIETLSPTSYTINFYSAAQVNGPPGGSGWYTFTGSPTVTWKVEDPDAGTSNTKTRLRISEIRGSSTKVNEYATDAAGDFWRLSTGGDGNGNFARVVTDNTATGFTSDTNPDGSPVSQSVVTHSEGPGGSATPTNYVVHYYNYFAWGTGEVRTEAGQNNDMQLTTRTFYPDGGLSQIVYPDGHHEVYPYDGDTTTTIDPFKDQDASGTSLNTGWAHEGSFDQINGQMVRQSTVSSNANNPLQEPLTRQFYNEQTTCDYSNAAHYQIRVDRTFTADSAALVAGQPLSTDYSDGRRDTWTYESGYINATSGAFTSQAGGPAVRKTVIHGTVASPGGIANLSTRESSLYDINGRLVTEETDVCTGANAFAPLTVTIHTNDAEGHRILSVRNGRQIYSAAWVNGLLASETNEQGIVTTYSNFDALGRALTVTKVGAAANGSYAAQPDLPTSLILDVEGRTLSQTLGVSGGPQQMQTFTYNTAGQLTSETSNGLATTYTYDNGGRTVTKTMPGGVTEVTDHYLDGRIKSISGTGVIAKAYNYGVVTADDGSTGDKAGYQWKIEYVGAGNPASPTARYTKTVTDWLGRTTRVETPAFGGGTFNTCNFYDPATGQLVRTTHTGLGDTLYTYDAMGNQNKSDQQVGTSEHIVLTDTSYLTDNSGNWSLVTKTSTSAGGTSTPVLVSSQAQQLTGLAANTLSSVTTTDALGQQTVSVTTVDLTNKLATTTTHVPGATNAAVQVSCNGLLVSASTPAVPSPSLLTYDALDRQSTMTDPGTGAVTTTTYAPTSGQPATIVTANGGLSTSTVNTYYGAGEANPGQLKSKSVNGMATIYGYNALNQVVQVSGNTYPLSYSYDAYGALKTLTTTGAAGNSTTTWVYDGGTGLLQQKLDASQKGPSYTYYPYGKVQTRTWARGIVTNYGYDGVGELTSTSYSDGVTPSVSLIYNSQGMASSVTDAAGTHTLSYAPDGQLASDSVGGSGIMAGTSVSVGYDSYGRRHALSASGAGGLSYSVGYGYDGATGNLSSITDNSAGSTVNYGYQPNSTQLATTTFSHSGAVRLTTTRTPDGLGRLASIVNTAGGTTGIVSSHTYTYNAQGQRNQATLADGSVWTYGYNTNGELTSGHHQWSSGGTPVAGQQFDYTYDSIGNRTSTTVNGRSATYTPNALNQYTTQQVPGAVDVLGTADPSATVTVNNLPVDSRQQGGYFYKGLSVSNTNTPVNQSVDVLAFKGGAGAGGVDVVSETQGNVFVPQTPEAFTYDDDGNLTQDGHWTYIWDGENQLVSMISLAGVPATAKKRLQFVYDWIGRRIQKQVFGWDIATGGYVSTPASTIRFLYDRWNLAMELDGVHSDAALRSYTWGMDLSNSLQRGGGVGGLVEFTDLSAMTGTQFHLACYDGNGNVTGFVNAIAGSPSAQYEYGPFGELLRAGCTDTAQANPIRWSSKDNELETGLIYYGFRFYNPTFGRWLSRDPLNESKGANLYPLLSNCPSCSTDIDGRQAAGYLEWPYNIVDVGQARIIGTNGLDDHVHNCFAFNGYGNKAAYISWYTSILSDNGDHGGPGNTAFNIATPAVAQAIAREIVENCIGISEDIYAYDTKVRRQVALTRISLTQFIWTVDIVVSDPVVRWCPNQVPHPTSYSRMGTQKPGAAMKRITVNETVPNA